MSKELKYRCQVTQSTPVSIQKYANLKNQAFEEAEVYIHNLIKLTEKKGFTQEEIYTHRADLNPAGIGFYEGIVFKRKYVRKVKTESLTIKDFPDIVVGMKIILDRIGFLATNKDQGIYEVTSYSQTHVNIKFSRGTHTQAYRHNDFYDKFKDNKWGIVEPTVNQKKFLKSCKNLITGFKHNDNNKLIYKGNNIFNLCLNVSPTNNCQLFNLYSAEVFINHTTCFVEQLKVLRDFTGKRLVLMDIKLGVLNYLENHLDSNWKEKDYVTMLQPYKSSNGSSMNILILNIEKL